MFGAAFLGIIGLVLWIVLAIWPAMIAKRKGYSFALFFILAIFISWLITLIIALVIKDKNETAESIADEKAAQAALERDENRSR
jgi:ABC-type Mn2+/Zn2+ transport system permease subunit